MNNVNLIANLTRDPELRSTSTGKPVADMRVAIPRRDRNAEPVYVDVTAFDGLAEQCAQYLHKGRQVAVSGRLEYSEWEADDGSRRSKHEVIANDVQFLARPKGDAQDGDGDDALEETQATAAAA